ncbi:uncharacterized protein J7T54_005259 [Emericellopsis cladophorae]|uniref:Reverse transcriptase domain-containing protein n=1 Tax=Emericellopsis cladophorae TaxID=2686198 RepID=A0A9P9Y1R3_9HYPO|nr:uncharacterized protein J7T54_005259 [Emericellopsis cladophorae]KAI6781548.1 hypothetical protein J7T54_005259 [Emericellopsis cladophorae]
MLQLDLKGAFDRVHHGWLVTTLEDPGWPRWVTRWVISFLTGRTATLTFDDWESEPLKVPAGVPQGSPLSPLLFILFSTPLFQRLRDIEGVGTKIAAPLYNGDGRYAETGEENATRAGNNQAWTLDNNLIKPAEETRFLGVYLDRRLNFIAHKNQILAKLKT